MSEDAREKLVQVLSTYGRSLVDDPRRCQALLKDHCPGNKREIHLLTIALEERIPQDLMASSHGLPIAARIAQQAKRLGDLRAVHEVGALWSVESWALALGLVGASSLSTSNGSLDSTGKVSVPGPPVAPSVPAGRAAQPVSQGTEMAARVGEVRALVKDRHFDAAEAAFEKIRLRYPTAALTELEDEIDAAVAADGVRQEEARRRRQQAKIVAARAGRWVGTLVAAGIVLALVGAVLLALWRWVVGAVAPSLQANNGMMIAFALGAIGLSTLIHYLRFTDFVARQLGMWFDQDALARAAFVVSLAVILIMSACGGLAYYCGCKLFGMTTAGGVTLGLFVGDVVGVAAVVHSFVTQATYHRG